MVIPIVGFILVNGDLELTIAQGGATKSGTMIVYLGE